MAGGGTVPNPSAAVYEKPHARERMGLMAYGPDKEKTALHIACKTAFCLCFLLSGGGGCDTLSYPF